MIETDLQLQQQIQAGADSLWAMTPATLAHKVSRGAWFPADHLKYISQIVASAIYKSRVHGIGDRIIVSVPPRHGKSKLISVWTPIWVLKHWPASSIILASYGSDLSSDFSRESRDTIIMEEEILGIKLKKDTKQVLRWMTEERGGMFAVGVGGPITGRGADVFLVDDYIKNAEEAASEKVRKSIYNWFTSTALTRLEPGAVMIIIATRWHPEDLSGKLIDQEDGGMPWRHIRLPAIAEEDDELGRKVGEALWPARYPKEVLNIIEKDVLEYYWGSLYQQRPVESRLGLYDGSKLQTVDIAPNIEDMLVIRSWDIAATPVEGDAMDPDWTVGTLFAYSNDLEVYLILDIKRERVGPSGVEELLKNTAEDDGPGVLIVLEQEPGSAGKNYIEMVQKHVLPEYMVKAVKPTGPKTVRANPLMAGMENGLVKALTGPYIKALRAEISAFPDGAHDDQIDSLSQAYTFLKLLRKMSPTWGRAKKQGVPKTRRGFNTGATFGRNQNAT